MFHNAESGYYNIDNDFRVYVTTETNEKFMALIDPSETVGKLRKFSLDL